MLLALSDPVVWLKTPTTLCGRFEGLDHLTLVQGSINIAFGMNVFTFARTRPDLAVSIITRPSRCATAKLLPYQCQLGYSRFVGATRLFCLRYRRDS